MAFFVWIATAVLTLHAANSYILLTANLEDVQAIAKQLANSPLSDEISKIWRRASTQFNKQLAKTDNQNQQSYKPQAGFVQRTHDDEPAPQDNQSPQFEDQRNEEVPLDDQESQDNQVSGDSRRKS